MALLALTNLGIVLFDLSYVPWRDLYLREFPGFTKFYDQFKGIEPHRETQKYLDTVEKLKAQVEQTGLQSSQVEPVLLQLRNLSVEIIESNPFEVAQKTGTLEKIKNKMRKRIGNESAKQSFTTFWSQPYLSQAGWSKEIQFYNKEIQPLIETNYFRPMGETGDFVDYFWKIDIGFLVIFCLEFLGRTYYIHRRHVGITWLDAMFWRWYDIFLLLPVWRWLRVIPVTIRLHQAHLLNLDNVQAQINRGFVANFAEELTEVVAIRTINQVQDSIRRGDITRLLSGRVSRTYIDINNVNEVEAIANLLVKVTVYQVLPKIQPDLEAILRHSLEKILNQSPVYRNLQQVPGLGNLPTQMIERLVNEVSQSAYQALTDTLEDPVGAELSQHLVQHFSEALGSEVLRQQTLQKIQSLLIDLLEEIKINYVKRLSEEDLEEVLEQTRQIRHIGPH
ncbi:MAG: hypothetical protein KME08_16060 [Aphanothece sp. CMT-3BRIN-NPC111]|jgi:hypothetical protein|nr:hypothetical protein [Aphanothece sp. CMT-3BRIN-NPC111]